MYLFEGALFRVGLKGTQKGEHTHLSFSPTAESFGVSAQTGSGVVRGGPAVRFHEGSTRVPQGFHEGSTTFCDGASIKKSTACCWGYHLSYLFLCAFPFLSYFLTAERFRVSAQIGSGVVGAAEVRFHEGSTRVPPGFHERGFHQGYQGSTRFCEGCGVVRAGCEVRFHEDSSRVPAGFPQTFHKGSTRVDGVVRDSPLHRV